MSSNPRDKGDSWKWNDKTPGPIAPNPRAKPDAAPPSPRAARRGNYSNIQQMGSLDSDGCVNDHPLQIFEPFKSGLRGRGFVVEPPAPPRIKLFPLR
jgi:hypothetical protein